MNSYSIERDKLVSRRKFKLQKNLIQNFNNQSLSYLHKPKENRTKHIKKQDKKEFTLRARKRERFKETAQILFTKYDGKNPTKKNITKNKIGQQNPNYV